MCPDDDLALLAGALGAEGAASLRPHFAEVALGDGEQLLVDGVPSGWLHLVVEGEFVVAHASGADWIELGTRGPGSWLGEVGVIDGGAATATVVARGGGRVLRIDQATVVRLTRERPEVASVLLGHLTRQLAERIAASSSGISERVGPGRVRVRQPEEVRSWVSTVLGWLLVNEDPSDPVGR